MPRQHAPPVRRSRSSRVTFDPVRETTEAFNELNPLVADDDLLEQLMAARAQVRSLIPDCIGMSMTLREQGVTFTLVATDGETAQLDATQYLTGGPCVEAVSSGAVIDFMTRQRRDWPVFAAAAEHYGVASTLSLPLLNHGVGSGGINLYGASPHCFDGHHEHLAQILGAWAGGAVTDVDLSFETRAAAMHAPRVLRDATSVDVAVGVLAATLYVGASEARRRLAGAADRAGLADVVVARMFTEVFAHGQSGRSASRGGR